MNMQNSQITGLDRLRATVPDYCADVTIGCSEIAGIVSSAIDYSQHLQQTQTQLQSAVSLLSDDQRDAATSCNEARGLSKIALEHLAQGGRAVQDTLQQVTELVELVIALGNHVSTFAHAMQQVRESSLNIEEIAETTNILALNATIKATRAGESGRTFGVVANEVKSLALETRQATDEITRTVENLSAQATEVVERVERGVDASTQTKTSMRQIEQTFAQVSGLVQDVDRQNLQIADATSMIDTRLDEVKSALAAFETAHSLNDGKLRTACDDLGALELDANAMFDAVVHEGLSPQDEFFVDLARMRSSEFVHAAEEALLAGDLTELQLFDTAYRQIDGSNPARFTTGVTQWADKVWQPMLDTLSSAHSSIVGTACSDRNGFLPTHLSERSRAPIGEVVHDTAWCRNGRIILQPIDRIAKSSDASYMMAVYRQEGDGRNYHVVRNVYVPLIINGRRWGDLEVAYRL